MRFFCFILFIALKISNLQFTPLTIYILFFINFKTVYYATNNDTLDQ